MFQQTIQEVKFEDIILSKKQQQARRTNKLRHWLEYMNMLDENKSFKQKETIIQELHKKFIFRQDFWLRECDRIFKSSKLNINDYEFIFLAMEDGFYQRVAKIINQKLYESFNKQQLRINYVIAKLQLLISKFNHLSNLCSIFFQSLVGIYIKSGNIKKVRQTYKRQIQMAFDNFDIAHQRYKLWQKQQNNNIQQKKLLEMFHIAKQKWSYKIKYIQQILPKIIKSNELQFSNQIQIKLALIYLENINSPRINQQKYIMLLSLLPNDNQRLWYLRRLTFSQNHQLVQQYLELLQKNQQNDQIVILNFKNCINWQKGLNYQMNYIQFLVRRINKHLLTHQNEDYNLKWGQNVEFFRSQIAGLIEKKRFNSDQQNKLRQKYYLFWIQVQAAIVKNSQGLSSIFQSFLAWGASQKIYLNYASQMLKLNDIKKAKFIYNKTCQSYNYSDQSVNSYNNFIRIYGSFEQSIKLKKKIKQANIKKDKNSINNNEKELFNKQQKIDLKQSKKKTKLSNQNAEQFFVNNGLTESSFVPINKNKQSLVSIDIIKQSLVSIDNTKTLVQENLNRVIQKQTKFFINKKQIAKQIILQNQIIKNSQQTPSFKRTSRINSEQFQQIQQKSIPIKRIHTDQKNTLFIKNIKKRWNQQDLKNKLKYKDNVVQIRLVGRQDKRVGYIEFDSEINAQKQLDQNKNLQLFYSQPPSKSDSSTLFLCNLPQQSTKQQIINLIPLNYQIMIKDVRIKQRHDKKMAYIQFKQQKFKDDVLSILKKDKIKLHDKYIIFMNCQSDNQIRDKKGKTIFLKNLSFKCNATDIKNYFQQKGFSTIHDIFIPKQENNKPKGFAYVQFKSSQETQKALQLKKGNIQKRQFSIHKSDRSITHVNQNKKVKQQQTQTKSGSANKPNKKSNNFFKNMF